MYKVEMSVLLPLVTYQVNKVGKSNLICVYDLASRIQFIGTMIN